MGLSKELKLLLLQTFAQRFIAIYATLFINFYIWYEEKSIFDVSYLNLITILFWNVTYFIGTKILYRTNVRVIMIISSFFSLIAFLTLLFPLEERYIWITIVSMAMGSFHGFYYSGKNLSISIYGKKEEFHQYFSITTVITQFVSLLTPILLAIFIYYFSYSASFIVMIVCSVFMLVASMNIPNFSLKNEPVEKKQSFKKVFSSSSLKWMFVSFIAAGLFRQFQSLFVLIFTYTLTENELYISFLNALYIVFTVLCIKIYKKARKVDDYRWLLIGICFITIGYAVALLPFTPLLVVSNILTTIGMYYYNTVFVSQHFKLINEQSKERQVGLFLWREITTNFLRCVMLTFILFIGDIKSIAFLYVLTVALISGFMIPFIQKKTFSKKS